ncbi:MAG: hypothetical protein IJ860_07225, partial [Eubacterium sp.]|nr:hypothetical protein [Eubacterium sp.]
RNFVRGACKVCLLCSFCGRLFELERKKDRSKETTEFRGENHWLSVDGYGCCVYTGRATLFSFPNPAENHNWRNCGVSVCGSLVSAGIDQLLLWGGKISYERLYRKGIRRKNAENQTDPDSGSDPSSPGDL